MGSYAKKGDSSKMVELWEMFTVECKNLIYKNQNKNNLFIKKYVQYQKFSN